MVDCQGSTPGLQAQFQCGEASLRSSALPKRRPRPPDAALLYLEEHDGFPDEIGERGAATVISGLADAELGLPVHVERAGLAEGLEEAVQVKLRYALFIAGEVLFRPRGEFSEFVPARLGGVLREAGVVVSRDSFRF